jgi:hypothetical protein
MPGVQEVLADDGDLEPWNRGPAQPQVQLAVSGSQEIRIGDATHVVVSGVELEVPREVERGSQGEVMLRVGRLRRAEGPVDAAGLGTDLDPLLRVAELQLPPVGRPVAGHQLYAVGFSFLSVGQHQRKESRRGGELPAPKVVVVVIEGRYRQRDTLGRLGPVSHLVGHQLLGMEVLPRQDDEVAIETRGSPHRPGHGGPESLAVARLPGQPDAGLKLEVGVRVVLDLGAEGQVQSVPQGNLVLRESAERLERDPLGGERQPDRTEVILHPPVPHAPDHVVSPPRRIRCWASTS